MSAQAGITPLQRDCLDFISGYCRRHAVSPSYDEIMRGLGLTGRNQVFNLVRQLEERGWIERLPNRARSIRVRQSGDLADAWRDACGAERVRFLAAIGAPASCAEAEV